MLFTNCFAINLFSEVTATKASPQKTDGKENIKSSATPKLTSTENYPSTSDSSKNNSNKDLVNDVGHTRTDPEERHWTDTLINLDQEVSPDKTSPVGSFEFNRHLENAFSQSREGEEDGVSGGGDFLEGAVCQDLLSELSR